MSTVFGDNRTYRIAVAHLVKRPELVKWGNRQRSRLGRMWPHSVQKINMDVRATGTSAWCACTCHACAHLRAYLQLCWATAAVPSHQCTMHFSHYRYPLDNYNRKHLFRQEKYPKIVEMNFKENPSSFCCVAYNNGSQQK